MTAHLRPPEHYVHGLAGPVTLVPARVASWLLAQPELEALRRRAVVDPEVRAVLTAIALVAADFRTRTGSGSEPRQVAEAGPPSTSMDTSSAATALGVSERAVRLACTDGRLPAVKDTRGHWRLQRCDVDAYRAHRAA